MDDKDMRFGFGYMVAIALLFLLGAGLYVYKDGIQSYLQAEDSTVNVTDD